MPFRLRSFAKPDVALRNDVRQKTITGSQLVNRCDLLRHFTMPRVACKTPESERQIVDCTLLFGAFQPRKSFAHTLAWTEHLILLEVVYSQYYN